MHLITLILLLALMFAYAAIGGVIFHYIESSNEQTQIKTFSDAINNFLNSRPCAAYQDVVDLQDLRDQLLLGGLAINSQGNLTSNSRFDVRSSISTAFAIFFGLGFSSLMPKTIGGKVFIDFFALISVFFEFTVIYFMAKLLDLLLTLIFEKASFTEFGKRHKSLDKLVRQFILAFVGTVLFLLIPAVIFSSLEKWTYGESLYFVTTVMFGIGFGEFVPGMNVNVGLSEDYLKWYRLAVGIWAMLTIVWFGTVLIQFNGAVGTFIWSNTEEAVDDNLNKFEKIKEKIKKKKFPFVRDADHDSSFSEESGPSKFEGRSSSGEVTNMQIPWRRPY